MVRQAGEYLRDCDASIVVSTVPMMSEPFTGLDPQLRRRSSL